MKLVVNMKSPALRAAPFMKGGEKKEDPLRSASSPKGLFSPLLC
jgi:hypothetical protein